MDGVIRIGITMLCHDGSGRYLLHWRSKGARDEHDRWDIGGGGVKFGEPVVDAMRRELKEEYGTEPLDFIALGWRDVFRVIDEKDTHWLQFDFLVRVDPAKAIVGEPHKNDGLKWFTKEELLTLKESVHSQYFNFLEKNKAFL